MLVKIIRDGSGDHRDIRLGLGFVIERDRRGVRTPFG
jgi:hypothetical protein